ncbi:L,D-transpeptidase family protein [Amycolatopsis sp. PS_44_ISF1]|uniref:L,D-transpeptidase family protein n=1 Tax=Amycolatopsis sp. PS_44_ISF1 TaxID=2974917 RepID=UPI0028E007DC|nr:L,D-transpeptidase family protein [Amycolatopsis sp. PS_44_ISF1]MDT8912166.1 L,D-transpeptidase family protein [Amycolatopsis sp. PS_44_ISF1]
MKRILGTVSCAVVLAALGATGLSDAAPAQTAEPPPLAYSGPARQLVTVVGSSASATTAVLTAWERSGGGWARALGPFSAFVGREGIGRASETTSHTPAGVFTLTEAFGIRPANGTRLPYRQVGPSDWWVSDPHSPLYNRYHSCAPGTCPFDEPAGEDLGRAGPVYDHATVIDYNRDPVVPGAGSAFFLHVSGGRPTAGCVAIPGADLDSVMRWLDPAARPVIAIGVR